MEKLKFAGMVLAAGYSSRMGKLKPLLPIAGKSAVRHLTDSFYNAGVSKVFVVTGHGREEIEPHVRDAITVFNPDYSEGMITSIKAGLREALKYDWDGIMFTPVDHAIIRPYMLKLLMREFTPEAEQVVFPTFNGRRGHPPLISRGIAQKLCELEGPWGAKRFLFSQGDAASDVEVGSPDMFADMDTPEDYEKLKDIYARKAPTAVECEYMLKAERTPDRAADHCRAVAERAIGLAEDAMFAGYKLDRDVVLAAAMLHDIKRVEPDHALAGALVLKENGFPFVAQAIAEHMDLPDKRVQHINESSIVYLADKLTDGVEYVSLEERLATMPDQKRLYGEPKIRKAMSIYNLIYK